MTTHIVTIGTDDEEVRDYSDIQSFEADLDDDGLYADGDHVVGECYDDSDFSGFTPFYRGDDLNQDNSRDSQLGSLTLRAASGEKHDGTSADSPGVYLEGSVASTGAIKVVCYFDLHDGAFTIEDLIINNLQYDGGNIQVYTGTFAWDPGGEAGEGTTVIQRNILKARWTSSRSLTHSKNIDVSKSGDVYLWNNVGYSARNYGIYLNPTTDLVGTATIYNNSIHLSNSGNYGHAGYGISALADTVVKNNIVTDCYDGDYDFHASSTHDYNLSSDTTATGTNSLISKTAATQFTSSVRDSENFLLLSSADANNAGVDLGSTAGFERENDIIDHDREADGTLWCMGANEAIGGINMTPAVASAVAGAVTPGVLVGYPSVSLTPAVASAVAGAVAPGVELGSATATPAVAGAVAGAVAPGVAFGSATATPAVASAVAGAVAPGVELGSLAVTPAVASAVAGAVAPGVAAGNVSLTPAAAIAVAGAVAPGVVLGSLSVTPPVAAPIAAGVSPGVALASVAVTPAVASAVAGAVAPGVELGNLAVTPAVASAVAVAVAPGVELGSLSVTPVVADVIISAAPPSVLPGSLSLTPTLASCIAGAVAPGVELGSLSVTPPVAAPVAAGVSPGVAFGSATVTPAVAVAVAGAVAPGVGLNSMSVTVTVAASVTSATLAGTIIGHVATPDAATAVASASVAFVGTGMAQGLEYDLPLNRLHYNFARLEEYTLPLNRLHFEIVAAADYSHRLNRCHFELVKD